MFVKRISPLYWCNHKAGFFTMELGILVLYHEWILCFVLSFGWIVLRWEMGTSANDQLLIRNLKLSFEIV